MKDSVSKTKTISELSNDQVDIDTVISFRCATGYKMFGPNEVKCSENGQWNETFPRCECK